ncbi:MAG: hypothetical protein A3B38_03985 [Candidatus Levybacteria bacterium RIFCSPLOWO2_01_FULL_36_13]|nr:MAG: hypothetical protein A2684_00920 [Candidatus Levybacteria bacterium RIFCSPHIGHO2_01_FULL_36_15b]OGH34288.1 MAG: hypothetical protein A3B38_03985 [Candidatus Levybacteria bacterium RIFCSPLOWO2_01_FULL_36_13]
MNKWIEFLKKYIFGILIILFSLIFSSWLMFSTFSYKDSDMLIAGKAWSDFGSHIPLIRSFSLGDNFPPQYPLFSDAPIKYHFLFYALTGVLEKAGLRIDFALNVPSIFGFSFLIIMIYVFAKKIFKSAAVGILSVILFLFNGSLSFLNFFSKHPLSINSFNEVLTNQTFPSFGPYDHTSTVSAFWNLNIYTNQRHLAISYGLSLFIIYLFLNLKDGKRKENLLKAVLIGIIFGISFFLNMAVFLMTIVILFCLFLFLKKQRIYIFITLSTALIFALPSYFYINKVPSVFSITTHFGYLVEKLNIQSFLSYWFQNLGLHTILILISLIIATKFQRKVFLSFFVLFIIGNLIQFSPEISANHKFFNYFMIIGVMFSSYFLVYLWNKRNILKPFVMVLIFFLTLSGIIDFFPILNDGKIALADYKKDKDIEWIVKNTPKNSIFLNTDYFMDKANIAGRKIFLGWPYFAWSQGYDTNSRDIIRKEMLNSKILNDFCTESRNYKLDFLETNVLNKYDFPINYDLFKNNLKLLYSSDDKSYAIYDIKKSCR